ncbi:uncharacterized protein LOC129234384 [Uloborus diversus]|uniref:uncharacterized protein LOC129234384 n=1 Tax=Uloborus diversus TaxID=327109 RepID=UPI00240A558B|nr:uncharacterized protein LOC129234384 [Uloborus diversus]
MASDIYPKEKGAYSTTSHQALYILSGIPPLELLIRQHMWSLNILIKQKPIHLDGIEFQSTLFETDAPKWFKCSYEQLVDTSFIHTEEIHPNQLLPRRIYTDGSKTMTGVGSAFVSFSGNTITSSSSVRLREGNSVFQAELLAIKNAIAYTQSLPQYPFQIFSDSLSSILALKNSFSKNQLVQTIQKQVLSSTKNFNIFWVKGHSNNRGNDEADRLAKLAADTNGLQEDASVPYPASHLKRLLTTQLCMDWQYRWDNAETSRGLHDMLPTIKLYPRVSHRCHTIFSTGHGPFPSYLNRFNIIDSPLCSCGEIGDSLHYIFDCPLTEAHHLRCPPGTSHQQRLKQALKLRHSTARLNAIFHSLSTEGYLYQSSI